MKTAGQSLRQVREGLRLKYRDVEEASKALVNEHGQNEFLVGLSRLADIENKGTTPSLYRLYSLCVIYRLKFTEVLKWYGIDMDHLAGDAARFGAEQTQPFDLEASDQTQVQFPLDAEEFFELRETTHLSRLFKRWGKLPIALLNKLEIRKHRYAFIGTDDWSMFPIIPAGSFVQLDESRKKVMREGWSSEHDRPIYFIGHRNGFKCGWCSVNQGVLVLQPHPTSREEASVFRFPEEVDVIGQVVGVVMRLDQGRKRHTHS